MSLSLWRSGDVLHCRDRKSLSNQLSTLTCILLLFLLSNETGQTSQLTAIQNRITNASLLPVVAPFGLRPFLTGYKRVEKLKIARGTNKQTKARWTLTNPAWRNQDTLPNRHISAHTGNEKAKKHTHATTKGIPPYHGVCSSALLLSFIYVLPLPLFFFPPPLLPMFLDNALTSLTVP